MANSVLCRLALGEQTIDAAAFTAVRLGAGALASGLGYAVWYSALRHLSLTRAALVQLAVPALAATGGVVFVAETVSLRLGVASAAILGSIALGIIGRSRRPE